MQLSLYKMGSSPTKQTPVSQLDAQLEEMHDQWTQALNAYIPKRRRFEEYLYYPKPPDPDMAAKLKQVMQNDYAEASQSYWNNLIIIESIIIKPLQDTYPESINKINALIQTCKIEEWNKIIGIYEDIADENNGYTDKNIKMIQDAKDKLIKQAKQWKKNNTNTDIIDAWIKKNTPKKLRV